MTFVHDAETRKSVHNRYSGLLHSIFNDVSCLCDFTQPEVIALDLCKIWKRIDNEGVSFLTTTLPELSKALYKAFAVGTYELPVGFKPHCKGDVRPKLLWSLHQQLFEENGQLKVPVTKNGIIAAKCINQISRLCYKAQDMSTIPRTKIDVKINRWFEVEERLSKLSFDDSNPILIEAADFVKRVFDDAPHPANISPKNGPGAVVEKGVRGNAKLNFVKVTQINRVYPYHVYFQSRESTNFCMPDPDEYNGPSNEIECANYAQYKLNYIDIHDTIPTFEQLSSRLVLVPKDARGPRIICVEPAEYMWIQQGLKDLMYEHLEYNCDLTRGRINFSNQDINRQLAQSASISCKYATLDMSDASDSISLKLIRALFKGVPTWLRALEAVRTEEVVIPGSILNNSGNALDLRVKQYKFSPMGSAITFPLEALSFFALAYGVAKVHNIKFDFWVYGDDIITSPELAKLLFEHYEMFGLKVNVDKSFTTGPFRESCGMDALAGTDIAAAMLRTNLIFEQSTSDMVGDTVQQITSLYGLVSNFFERGFVHSAKFVQSIILQNTDSIRIESPNYKNLPVLSFPPLSQGWETAVDSTEFYVADDYLDELISDQNPIHTSLNGHVNSCVYPFKLVKKVGRPYDLQWDKYARGLSPRAKTHPDVGCMNESAALCAGLLSAFTDEIPYGADNPILDCDETFFRLKSITFDIASAYPLQRAEIGRLQNVSAARVDLNNRCYRYSDPDMIEKLGYANIQFCIDNCINLDDFIQSIHTSVS